MVGILPPRTDVGSMVGQGLGQGFGAGMAKGADIGFQRNLLDQAVKGLQNAKTPMEQAQFLARIAQVSPYAAQLLQPMVQTAFRSGIYGNQGSPPSGNQGGGSGQNNQINQGGMGGQGQSPVVAPDNSQIALRSGNPPSQMAAMQGQQFPNNLGTSPSNLTPGMEGQGSARENGFTSHVMTPQEEESRIGQLMSQYYIPQDQATEMVANEQARRVGARATGEKKARQVLDIGGENPLAKEADIPEIMLLGEQLSHINDPDRWARALKDSWQNYKDQKTALAKAFVPGFWQKMLTSKESQQQALERLVPISQKFVKMGMEQELRKKLLDRDLSETQVEAQIHPWTEKNKAQLSSLPNGLFRANIVARGPEELKERFPEGGLKNYEETLAKNPGLIDKQNENLSEWMKKNVTPDMSLNVLRQHLWKDKGYDWRQIATALTLAQRGENALVPSQRQGIEESTVLTQPPIEDLSSILLGWDRVIRTLQKSE